MFASLARHLTIAQKVKQKEHELQSTKKQLDDLKSKQLELKQQSAMPQWQAAWIEYWAQRAEGRKQRREQKYREYWAKMTDQDAKEIAEALFCEGAYVRSGEFSEEYKKMKAAGLTGTMEKTKWDTFDDVWVPRLILLAFLVFLFWIGSKLPT